jgi:hypothetical protein
MAFGAFERKITKWICRPIKENACYNDMYGSRKDTDLVNYTKLRGLE